MRLITITETCIDEKPQTCTYDYDALPQNVKDKVDLALSNKYNEVYVNIYKDGIQYLHNIDQPIIKNPIGNVEFLGSVYLSQSENYEDYEDDEDEY